MSYSGIVINLLPPELRPGPVVRYRVMINALMIIVTVAFLALDAVIGINRLGMLNSTLITRRAEVESGRPTIVEHSKLMEVNNYVERTGRLVSLASADYTDLPLVLQEVANLLPEGVYLERVTNDRAGKDSTQTNVIFALVSGKEDPALVLETFNRFKSNQMLGNCFLRMAEAQEVSLFSLLESTDVNWSVTGPDIDPSRAATHFAFEIYAMVEAPIVKQDLPVLHDDTRFLASFEKRMEAELGNQENENLNANEPKIINAPPGVTVKEVQ